MSFKSRVAIIGPEDLVVECFKFENSFPNLLFLACIYEEEEEITDIVQRMRNEVDLLFFAGVIPYYKVKEMPELEIMPAVYIPYNGSGVLKAIIETQRLMNNALTSIDTVDKELIIETYKEIGMDPPEYILEFDDSSKLEGLIDYHTNLFRSGRIHIAITSMGHCYKELIELGIPAVRIKPLHASIRETFVRAQLICENIQSKNNYLAVGSISIGGLEEWRSTKSVLDEQELNLKVEQAVFKFVKTIDGQYVRTAPGEFLFFTTRSFIYRSTSDMKNAPDFFQSLKLPEGLYLSMGVGFGLTTNLAAEAARAALTKSKEVISNTCFVVNEEHQLLGPLGSFELEEQSMRNTDEGLDRLSSELGINKIVLDKLLQAVKELKGQFTANEIAPLIGITVKSAQRLIRNLEQAQHIKIVGQEALWKRGKPRRVYSFNEEIMQLQTDLFRGN
ncbi:helix-turn-helix domain-containing protein [Paenibacillus sp. 7124]|uniref:Helix-turn-helix domain-containing protein n=1 Tax=Paenibacillus apii TaxID=1850370 RepID=A0A6M1PS85_9BACL|nr:helix-turn-helix domain-containing protein [Paenibacillus apii]NGM85264.1 helix-turn-helix domain-containing protein [Paenibacillus apii]